MDGDFHVASLSRVGSAPGAESALFGAFARVSTAGSSLDQNPRLTLKSDAPEFEFCFEHPAVYTCLCCCARYQLFLCAFGSVVALRIVSRTSQLPVFGDQNFRATIAVSCPNF